MYITFHFICLYREEDQELIGLFAIKLIDFFVKLDLIVLFRFLLVITIRIVSIFSSSVRPYFIHPFLSSIPKVVPPLRSVDSTNFPWSNHVLSLSPYKFVAIISYTDTIKSKLRPNPSHWIYNCYKCFTSYNTNSWTLNSSQSDSETYHLCGSILIMTDTRHWWKCKYSGYWKCEEGGSGSYF